jgi:ribosomal protein L21E
MVNKNLRKKKNPLLRYLGTYSSGEIFIILVLNPSQKRERERENRMT